MLHRLHQSVNAFADEILAQHSHGSEHFESIAGKSVQITFPYSLTTFFIVFHTQGFHLQKTHAQTPDLTITGSPIALLRFLTEKKSTAHHYGLNIEGSLTLAEQLQSLQQKVDIDWGSYIATITGDAIAHRIEKLFENLTDLRQRKKTELAEDIPYFFQQDAALLPSQHMVNTFLNNVETVRDDTARLIARANRLEKMLSDKLT